MADQSQVANFETAKQAIFAELGHEATTWDFPLTLQKLREAITANPSGRDFHTKARSFSCHHLNISRQEYRKVNGWFRGQEMSVEEITLVLRVLNHLHEHKPSEDSSRRLEKHGPKKVNGITRKIIDVRRHVAPLSQNIFTLA